MDQNTDNKNTNGVAENLNEVGAIRNILFGQYMQQYDAAFAKMQAHIDALEKSLGGNLDETEANLTKSLNEMNQKLDQKMEKNHTDLLAAIQKLESQKVNKKDLGKMLIQIGEKLSS